MTDGMDDADIQARYAARFAADLENNEKEQEALRARLVKLETERAWLMGMRGTVAKEQDAPAKEAGKSAVTAGVPQPRRAKKAAGTQGRRKKAAPAKGAEAPKATATRTKKGDGPTLGELVLGLLGRHHQPRMVSEVVNELGQAHPERVASTQVVRNTVEALVAKGRLERERKQGSVFYTAPGTKDAAAPEAAAPAPAPEAEEATAKA
ncbi:hypothetical protein [Streptomyces sp. NPDC051162]|uniref:hypothetical protein n=1 Tax=unclassified Streptomyces TaxID=2593676 RepID=UPI00343CB209